MKELKLGLPYMGSKRKLARQIVDKILQDNPNTKYVYDLFGGGGAISFEFLQRPQIQKVVYNELNTGIVELLKDVLQNGVTEKYYQWIDRDTFNANKNKDDWMGGFCKCVWSFGNGQKSYLFGRKIENIKRIASELIVTRDTSKIQELKNLIGLEIPHEIINIPTIRERRLFVYKIIRENLNTGFQIQQLERIKQLEIKNLSYEEVEIKTPLEETIIYLDPPYPNTATYQKELDYIKLNEYIKNSPYKIYLSSYESDLRCVAEFEHRATVGSAIKRKVKKTIEKLFTNKI